MNTRKVYVKRDSKVPNTKWSEIHFKDIQPFEEFILCEADGTPVGHFIALDDPYKDNGIDTILNAEIGIIQ